jgi:hypothetical protein
VKRVKGSTHQLAFFSIDSFHDLLKKGLFSVVDTSLKCAVLSRKLVSSGPKAPNRLWRGIWNRRLSLRKFIMVLIAFPLNSSLNSVLLTTDKHFDRRIFHHRYITVGKFRGR